MKIDNNPYAPPDSVGKTEDVERSRLAELLFEAVHALITIVFVLASWAVIGTGFTRANPTWVAVGFLMMIATCGFGVMFSAEGRSFRKSKRRVDG